MTATEDYRQISALVVGLGSIGVRHLENLRALGVGRLGVLRRRGRPLHKEVDLAGVDLHGDLESALARGYDLVVVANPTALHLPVALAAARAGCHLYIDKPVSHTLEGLDELAGEVERQGLKVQVGCQLRFDPCLIQVRKWLAQGLIGRPVQALCQVGEWLPGWHPWEDYRQSYAARADQGGGVVLTTIHEIDYLHWLLGPLIPLAAAGGVSGALELDVEDHASILLGSDTGAAICLTMDYLQRPPVRELKIVGTEGTLTWDYLAGSARLFQEGRAVETTQLPPGWERNHMYLAITRDLLQAIQQERPPAIPLEQGIAVLKTALAVKQMMRG